MDIEKVEYYAEQYIKQRCQNIQIEENTDELKHEISKYVWSKLWDVDYTENYKNLEEIRSIKKIISIYLERKYY